MAYDSGHMSLCLSNQGTLKTQKFTNRDNNAFPSVLIADALVLRKYASRKVSLYISDPRSTLSLTTKVMKTSPEKPENVVSKCVFMGQCEQLCCHISGCFKVITLNKPGINPMTERNQHLVVAMTCTSTYSYPGELHELTYKLFDLEERGRRTNPIMKALPRLLRRSLRK